MPPTSTDRYAYFMRHRDEVAAHINLYADEGYHVAWINRNKDSEVVDVLMVKKTRPTR